MCVCVCVVNDYDNNHCHFSDESSQGKLFIFSFGWVVI